MLHHILFSMMLFTWISHMDFTQILTSQNNNIIFLPASNCPDRELGMRPKGSRSSSIPNLQRRSCCFRSSIFSIFLSIVCTPLNHVPFSKAKYDVSDIHVFSFGNLLKYLSRKHNLLSANCSFIFDQK